MHGNGNDFIVIDNRGADVLSTERLAEIARVLCHRHFAIGADGILVVESCDGADFKMRLFNADGSEGEMCGNGARCIARYAYERKICGRETKFLTLAGMMRATVTPPFVELDMGMIDLSGGTFEDTMSVKGITYKYTFLTVGVPHCVLFADDFDFPAEREKLFNIGKTVRGDFSRFPKGTNVNFVKRSGADVWAVTYERGVEDLTDSCGTGCVATAIAVSMASGRAAGGAEPLSTRIFNPGGMNEVSLTFDRALRECHAWLKGKAVMVAEGRLCDAMPD